MRCVFLDTGLLHLLFIRTLSNLPNQHTQKQTHTTHIVYIHSHHTHTPYTHTHTPHTPCCPQGHEGSHKGVVRRSAQDTHYHSTSGSEHSVTAGGPATGGVVRVAVLVCVGLAGIVGLLAVLAMCAHSTKDYQPEVPDSR